MAPTVLVIEDESDILTYLMAVLEDHGFEACTVSAAGSIAAAVTAAAPDLILLDVMMPMRSGVSIYKELRATSDFSRIPVVILSGFSSHGSRMPGEFRSMLTDESIPPPDGFVDKPVDLDQLIALVRGLTGVKEVS